MATYNEYWRGYSGSKTLLIVHPAKRDFMRWLKNFWIKKIRLYTIRLSWTLVPPYANPSSHYVPNALLHRTVWHSKKIKLPNFPWKARNLLSKTDISISFLFAAVTKLPSGKD